VQLPTFGGYNNNQTNQAEAVNVNDYTSRAKNNSKGVTNIDLRFSVKEFKTTKMLEQVNFDPDTVGSCLNSHRQSTEIMKTEPNFTKLSNPFAYQTNDQTNTLRQRKIAAAGN